MLRGGQSWEGIFRKFQRLFFCLSGYLRNIKELTQSSHKIDNCIVLAS